jgi:hypothetical protein
MSFNYHARRVRDRSRPVWCRLQNLRSCVASFSWLTGTSFTGSVNHFGIEWRRDQPREPPTDEFLISVLTELERTRNQYLEALWVFDRRRVRAKTRGSRQMSNVERLAFRELQPGLPYTPSRGWLLRNV